MPIKDPEKLKAARKRADEKRSDERAGTRTRVFATVVYPESAPQDWLERLSEAHVAALVSPLHDRDTNPSGEAKKPHWHVLVMYEGPKAFDTQVKPLFDAIGGVGREVVNSTRGYARYLCHLDNPEKFQYSTQDVRQLGGADFAELIHLPTDDNKMLIELFAFIREQELLSFADLLDITAMQHPDWFTLITARRGYVVDKYIKSLVWEQEHGYTSKLTLPAVDDATGELVI